jgi:HTH-type transcriptional regulator / antitoxin HigA
MTTGIKTPSALYLKLINDFPPRPIQDVATFQATQSRINDLLDGKIDDDVRDYLRVLGMLVYDYEEQTEPPMPTLSSAEREAALAEGL